MAGFFYNLGRRLGPQVRKGKWFWHSLTGTKAEILQAEYEVGRDLHDEIRRQTESEPDPELRALLNDIGAKLAGRLHDKRRRFRFEAIKGADPNAFALPGGFIFLTGPLGRLCRDESDELAFILAHEMGHVVRGHARDRILARYAISAAARTPAARHLAAGMIKQLGIQFLENAYAHNLELQADEFAIRLADAAGYDPAAGVTLLSRLDEWQSRHAGLRLGSYFSSHPPFAERIAHLRRFCRRQ